MNDESTTCQYCGGPLTAIHVQDHPELVDLNCTNTDCGTMWINQASRYTGPGSLQIGFGETGVSRRQRGKPQQGEDNCQPVAKAMLKGLGVGFSIATPCPEKGAKRDSTRERGFDFSLQEPCGHMTEIQVTCVPEKDYYSALAAAHRNGEAVVDERPHATLIDLLKTAIRKKSEHYPTNDRAARVLAIDGRCPSVGLNFFFTRVRFVDMAEVFGWRGIVLVDERNMLFLGPDSWPDCPECGRCR